MSKATKALDAMDAALDGALAYVIATETEEELADQLSNLDQETLNILINSFEESDITALRKAAVEADDSLDESHALTMPIDELIKRIIRGGKLVLKTIKRIPAALRRKMSIAAKKGARKRRGKRRSAATRRKQSRSLKKRSKLNL